MFAPSPKPFHKNINNNRQQVIDVKEWISLVLNPEKPFDKESYSQGVSRQLGLGKRPENLVTKNVLAISGPIAERSKLSDSESGRGHGFKSRRG